MIYLFSFIVGASLALLFSYYKNLKRVNYHNVLNKCKILLDNLETNKDDWVPLEIEKSSFSGLTLKTSYYNLLHDEVELSYKHFINQYYKTGKIIKSQSHYETYNREKAINQIAIRTDIYKKDNKKNYGESPIYIH